MDITGISYATKSTHFIQKMLINALFVIAVSIIIAINVICYVQINKFSLAHKWLIHSYQVIDASNNILSGILAGGSLVRGYAITGDENFLNNLPLKIDTINKNYAATKMLVSDNALQEARLAALKPLLDGVSVGFQKVIQLQQTDKITTLVGYELLRQNQANYDKAQEILQQLNQTEVMLLQERAQLAYRSFEELNFFIVLTSIISMCLLIAGIIVVNILQNKQIQAEKKRSKADVILKGFINGTSDLIVALDKDFRFLVFNRAYEFEFKKLFGKQVILGASIKELLKGSVSAQQIIKNWEKALKGEEFMERVELGEAGFKVNTYEASYNTLYNDQGEIIGAATFIRNINAQINEERAQKVANEKLEEAFRELKQHNEEMLLINEMDNALQTCSSIEETISIIQNYCKKIFNSTAGILYLMHESRAYLEQVLEWGDPSAKEKIFSSEECWSLRQSKLYVFNHLEKNLPCKHAQKNRHYSYVCAPLLSSNEIVGLLYIEIQHPDSPNKDSLGQQLKYCELLVSNFSSQLALSISNIKLRDRLSVRSLHDPLTGLYNRYYLDESLDRELQRAGKSNTSLAVIMMDIDHFKKINDDYGHEAGDAALREVAKILQNLTRKTDVVCRYGGEEFLFVFYDVKIKDALERTQRIQEAIRNLQFEFNGVKINITASFGIAIYPDHGLANNKLIDAADQALYVSKNDGRDRTTIFDPLRNGFNSDKHPHQ